MFLKKLKIKPFKDKLNGFINLNTKIKKESIKTFYPHLFKIR